MTWSWLLLIGMVCGYGTASFLQGIAATRSGADSKFAPGLLLRLARQRTYLAGVGFQAVGALFAIMARRDLPLFLVQAAVGAGLAVTALLGVGFLRWRLPRAEIALMCLVALGLAGLIAAAKPSRADDPNTALVIALGSLVVIFPLIAHFTAKLHGAAGSVTLGALGGLAFGAAAIASRPLVNASSLGDFLTDPLLYVFGAHMVAGQLIFGLALQRGATTAASAAMNAMAAPVAVVGLLLLGDQVHSGLGWLAVAGFVVALGATIGMAWFAAPQNHEWPNKRPDEPGGKLMASTEHAEPSAAVATPAFSTASAAGQKPVA